MSTSAVVSQFLSSYCRIFVNTLDQHRFLIYIQTGLVGYYGLKYLKRSIYELQAYNYQDIYKDAVNAISKYVFKLFMLLPSNKSVLNAKIQDAKVDIHKKLLETCKDISSQLVLPDRGIDLESLQGRIQELSNLEHPSWEKGRVSGVVYHGGVSLTKVIESTLASFSLSNPLHPSVFPGLRKMEAEIVSMTLNLFNAPKDSACGTTTSGGTESLILACLAYKRREYERKGITEPEMIVPVTAHAAFEKAANYFNIKLRHARINMKTGKVDISHVKRLINSNTVLLVGSAPNFPHGIIDEIELLGKLAERYDIGLHVDACLGSFLVPFMNDAHKSKLESSNELPIFDFRIKAVTSISCDTHKYGFAPKGSSVIMYRTHKLRHYQYFVSTEWSGGVYASPTIAGSRPGALIAGCWAAMMATGLQGYRDSAIEIIQAAQRLKSMIQTRLSAFLEVIGDPLVSVVAFKSKGFSIYKLGDLMSERGWELNGLQNPPALHMAVTRPSVSAIDDFVNDLEDCIKQIMQEKSEGQHEANDGTMATLYGAGNLPDKSVISDVAKSFIDALFLAN